ncbi:MULTISPECIES: HD family phosphohydrolase [Odoribacteraceae]|uniref:HD family phosphohydrolase n=1 Tax=Odoribacteraceae TaxID=1853231 RepID=UPI001F28D786|nr:MULTISPECIES: HDIG domain-containing metalloprotein [Odoribacteraceae]MCQ4875002.1 HDIG domain-containing protein [Butyricimonas paravirosa]
MPNNKNKKHRTIQYVFKISTIIIICGLIVLLLPKIEGFKYSYQKGMPWKYETLIAPLDFPLHKSSEEITADIEKIRDEQAPIFNFKETNIEGQISKFSEKLNPYRTHSNEREMDRIVNKLREIYSKGILLMPEKLDVNKVKNILVVKDNIAIDEKFSNVFTLKQAYETLVKYIKDLQLPKATEEGILSMGLNNYINPNLEYDAVKTGLAIETNIKSITPTQGMVNRGDIIISKNDLVTPEKYKVLESFRIEHEQSLGSTIDRIRITVAQTVLTLIAIMSFSIFLYVSRKRLFYNNKDFFFLYSMFLLTIALGSISYFQHINILTIPVLFFPIIVNILFGTRPALYLLLGTTMLISYYAPNNYMYFFMQISAGIVAMFSLSHLQRRSQLFIALGLVFLTYILVYGAFTLIQEGTFEPKHLLAILLLMINTVLLSLIYPALYLVERLFGYTSEISLLEYSNPNHPALRNLTKKAPGTFQHSLMVANLAEEAIYHIGGSPLLARTGALYHDIGKSYNPIMFIENQTGGLNPHSSLDFDESAQIIIGHVTQGLELANKYKLPEALKDFIRTHHGKSKVKYFYYSFKNKYPDKEINEALFTYPGPDPVRKECAVVMMADGVEAASRALEIKDEENLTKLVNDLINGLLNEGRFANADLTFKDISTVKRVFSEMLINVYHARIAYPKLQTKS